MHGCCPSVSTFGDGVYAYAVCRLDHDGVGIGIMVFFGRSFYVSGVRHALGGKANMDTIGRTQYFDRFSVQPFQYFMSRILVGKRAGTTCLL